jgi:hypothetical protein
MQVFWICVAIVLWAVHFAVLYGYTGLACARGYGHTISWVIAGATLAAVPLTAAIAARGWRERAQFTGWLTASVAAFALIAMSYEALAAILTPACA